MLLLALVLSYICGSIPFGVLAGRLRGVDVQTLGSGNIGATNVWRVLGPKWGAPVFALDVLKGLAGPLIGRALLSHDFHLGIALCAAMTVVGHTFSIFLKFKGGKGVATGLGMALGLMPYAALTAFALWGVLLGLTRYISLASIVACLSAFVLAVMTHQPWPYTLVVAVAATVVFIKHIPNMKRLASGTEPKIGQKKAAPGAQAEGIR